VSNPFHPITNEAAFSVASNLSEADRRECAEGYGFTNVLDIALPVINSESYYFKTPDGRSAAMGGVEKDGRIWMLCTPLVKEYPITFARDCRRMIDSRKEKLLWNIADKRNTTHLKLLRFLGFKFLREVIHGPNNLTFIEFCKIQCAHN
tara:strand:- start:3498 stop:3944 length:447 start_codon:yes stop_codon:yes gene_type:complete